MDLGPEGWTGFQQVDMEGKGAIWETKGIVWIKDMAVLLSKPV